MLCITLTLLGAVYVVYFRYSICCVLQVQYMLCIIGAASSL